MAVPWADGVLNPVNARLSPPEMARQLEETETRILFVDDPFTREVPEAEVVVYMGEGATPSGMLAHQELIDSSTPIEDARRGGDALAGIFYTGGTTGLPKGVMVSHNSLLTSVFALEAAAPTAARETTVLVNPMFHMSGFLNSLLTWTLGGRVVIVPSPDALEIIRAIDRYRGTYLFAIPSTLRQIVDHPEAGDHDLSSLRNIQYGGAPIEPPLLERVVELLPHVELMQGWGQTELGVATLLSPEDHRDGTRLRSAGRANLITEVRVVDSADREVPRGEVGELVCRADTAMLGYWNQPEETAHTQRGGWTHTGDVGYMDDSGYVYIVDRIKDMIIVAGVNVYSAEVEDAIATHPAVASCAVIAVPDDRTGERVHAVIVLKPGCTADTAEIRQHCHPLIAAHKIPGSCESVEALPLSPIGKPLKRQLREPHWRDKRRQVN